MSLLRKILYTSAFFGLFSVFSKQEIAFAVVKYDPPFSVVTSDFPPFSYLKNGQPSGVMVDIIQEVLKELENDGKLPKISDVQINFVPWKRAYRMASEGTNVMLFPMGINPERNKQFAWVGPRFPRSIWIYSLKTDKTHALKKQDFKGKLVGIVRGYSWDKDLRDISAIPDETVDDRMLVRKLAGHRMDYIAMDEEVLRYTLQLMKDTDPFVRDLKLEKVYPLFAGGERTFGLSKTSDQDLIARLQSAYLRLEKRGTIKKICKRYDIRY
ncbi:ABC transporter substrate-binding protein [Bdellovibrio sp. NC01]|uniref:substrate-binding periplasmic protein n=1 Tax=Bdellovibrio sp. NC01 TaxID=2220073 RepID=UPI00143CFC8E|nr:ABC transporter substrate-binding protein [Bdellovibrio sp. NC01]